MKNLVLIAGLTAALSTPAFAATNLLANGGFEANPGITNSYYNIGPSGSGASHPVPVGFGWTVSLNNVDILSWAAYGPGPTNGGNYGLDLVGLGSTGEISQSIATVAGRTYDVSLDYASNPGFNLAQADVLVNGVAIGSVTGIANTWQTFTGSFTGTGSTVTFAINETRGGNNGGVFLDNVSVTGVPEVSTWAMMLSGFVGLGLVGYRRQKTVQA